MIWVVAMVVVERVSSRQSRRNASGGGPLSCLLFLFSFLNAINARVCMFVWFLVN